MRYFFMKQQSYTSYFINGIKFDIYRKKMKGFI